MAENVESLVLTHLRAMREENAQYRSEMVAGLEHVKRALEIMGRVGDRLAMIDARLSKIEGDLVHMENQNISRHGETLSLGQQIKSLTAGVEHHTGITRDVILKIADTALLWSWRATLERDDARLKPFTDWPPARPSDFESYREDLLKAWGETMSRLSLEPSFDVVVRELIERLESLRTSRTSE